MTDAPDRYICFVHAKLGASPGWGAASRLVSIVGKADIIDNSYQSVAVFTFTPQLSLEGRQKALRLLGTSATVQAGEALSSGLIDGIVQDTKSEVPTSYAEVRHHACYDDLRLHPILHLTLLFSTHFVFPSLDK